MSRRFTFEFLGIFESPFYSLLNNSEMPRGKSGKSMLGGVTTAIATQSAVVSHVVNVLNAQTATVGPVKTVEDLEKVVGIFNSAISLLGTAKKNMNT